MAEENAKKRRKSLSPLTLSIATLLSAIVALLGGIIGTSFWALANILFLITIVNLFSKTARADMTKNEKILTTVFLVIYFFVIYFVSRVNS